MEKWGIVVLLLYSSYFVTHVRSYLIIEGSTVRPKFVINQYTGPPVAGLYAKTREIEIEATRTTRKPDAKLKCEK